jgi:hypothetical protein
VGCGQQSNARARSGHDERAHNAWCGLVCGDSSEVIPLFVLHQENQDGSAHLLGKVSRIGEHQSYTTTREAEHTSIEGRSGEEGRCGGR